MQHLLKLSEQCCHEIQVFVKACILEKVHGLCCYPDLPFSLNSCTQNSKFLRALLIFKMHTHACAHSGIEEKEINESQLALLLRIGSSANLQMKHYILYSQYSFVKKGYSW